MSENNQINNGDNQMDDYQNQEMLNNVSDYYSDLVEKLLEERKKYL
ncbi:MAG: hypothetical protein PHS49_04320 [Candidatus Gracilibacteria bacterium]|nr:hypothetical protein [Candidatus Gracilibacteria bacterium]